MLISESKNFPWEKTAVSPLNFSLPIPYILKNMTYLGSGHVFTIEIEFKLHSSLPPPIAMPQAILFHSLHGTYQYLDLSFPPVHHIPSLEHSLTETGPCLSSSFCICGMHHTQNSYGISGMEVFLSSIFRVTVT